MDAFRLLAPLDKASVVRLSPHSTHAQSPAEGQAGQSEGYSYSPILATSALVQHTGRPVSSDSDAAPSPPLPDLISQEHSRMLHLT